MDSKDIKLSCRIHRRVAEAIADCGRGYNVVFAEVRNTDKDLSLSPMRKEIIVLVLEQSEKVEPAKAEEPERRPWWRFWR